MVSPEALERLEADDVRPAGAEAGEGGFEPCLGQRDGQRLGLEERYVHVGSDVPPGGEVVAERRGIARGEEEETTGAHDGADTLQLRHRVDGMLDDLDSGNHVK